MPRKLHHPATSHGHNRRVLAHGSCDSFHDSCFNFCRSVPDMLLANSLACGLSTCYLPQKYSVFLYSLRYRSSMRYLKLRAESSQYVQFPALPIAAKVWDLRAETMHSTLTTYWLLA